MYITQQQNESTLFEIDSIDQCCFCLGVVVAFASSSPQLKPFLLLDHQMGRGLAAPLARLGASSCPKMRPQMSRDRMNRSNSIPKSWGTDHRPSTFLNFSVGATNNSNEARSGRVEPFCVQTAPLQPNRRERVRYTLLLPPLSCARFFLPLAAAVRFFPLIVSVRSNRFDRPRPPNAPRPSPTDTASTTSSRRVRRAVWGAVVRASGAPVL